MKYTILLSCLALFLAAPLDAVAGETNMPPDLDAAIKNMRNIRPDTVPEKDRAQKAQDMTKAWAAIVAAGPAGTERIKKELKAIEGAKEKDDYFSLGAASLLWMIAKSGEAEEIGRIWRTAELTVNFNYVYVTALNAAATRDPKVAPMLTALLHDRQGKFFVTQHVMNVAWPLTMEFVWGIYGTAGLPVLDKVLTESQDPTELQTSMLLLAKAQYLNALPSIRKLAEHKDRDVRAMALRCLGLFGHPDDFDVLIKQLKSDDPVVVESVIAGLAQYGDLRAAKDVAPFADSQNERVRKAALSALVEDFLCPASLEALHEHLGKFKDPKENAICADGVDWLLKFVGQKWDEYQAKAPEAREKLFIDTMKSRAQTHTLDAKGRKFDHADLLKAAEDRKKQHALSRGPYGWVTGNQIIATMNRIGGRCLF